MLPGFIKGRKLHALLSHARCFVLPSSHEGLPIALLEAMSYRLPVIVSDIPANLEVGLGQEFYFPLGDRRALARKLQENMDAPYRQIEYPMEKYDWNAIAERTASVYTKYSRRLISAMIAPTKAMSSAGAIFSWRPRTPALM